ncbi:WD repeat-containing protein 75-like [Planoprotostelium fungivorum]|uniref:WD repeat-containing protein 75-like n=1 Tax=Planoprotostelium fungivorum TaxID=1890364 RepID=A0A2P6NR23_9EUKA|nr:WD repeat-containing protein 75-like [Planoprotostelium fungivorum]
MVWTTFERRGKCISFTPIVFTSDSLHFFNAAENTLQMHDVTSGDILRRMEGHEAAITSIVLDPFNNQQVFTSSYDGTIRTWDYVEGRMVSEFKAGGLIHAMAYSQEEKTFYYATGAKKSFELHRWKEGSSAVITKFHGFPTGLHVVPGNFVLLSEMSQLHVYHKNRLYHTYNHDLPILCISVSPDNQLVAIGDVGGHIDVIYELYNRNVEHKQKTRLLWHANGVDSLAFTPDGREILSGGSEGVVVIWSIESQTKNFMSRGGSLIRALSVSPDGSTYGVSYVENILRLYDSQRTLIHELTGLKTDPSTNRDWKGSSALCTSTQTIAVTHRGTVQFYDPKNDRVMSDAEVARKAEILTPGINLDSEIVHLSMSNETKDLVTIEARRGLGLAPEYNLRFWETNNHTIDYTMNTLVPIHAGDHVTSLHMCQGARLVVTTREKGNFDLWERSQDGWQCRLTGTYGTYKKIRPNCCNVSYDGSLVAIAYGEIITLWDTVSGKLQCELVHGNGEPVKRMTFLGNTPFLVTVSVKHVNVWNLCTLSLWYTYELEAKSDTVLVAEDSQGRFVVYNEGPRVPAKISKPEWAKSKVKNPKNRVTGHGAFRVEIEKRQPSSSVQGGYVYLFSVHSVAPLLVWKTGQIPVRSLTFGSFSGRDDAVVAQLAYVNAFQELFVSEELDANTVVPAAADGTNQQPLFTPTESGAEVAVSSKTGAAASVVDVQVHLTQKKIFEQLLGDTPAHVLPPPSLLYSSLISLLIEKKPVVHREEGSNDRQSQITPHEVNGDAPTRPRSSSKSREDNKFLGMVSLFDKMNTRDDASRDDGDGDEEKTQTPATKEHETAPMAKKKRKESNGGTEVPSTPKEKTRRTRK